MKKSNTSLRLKEIMDARGLRQVDVLRKCRPYCEKTGVKLTKSDLSQYVSGKTTPNQDKLTILGLALGVEETWLMGYDAPEAAHLGHTVRPTLNNDEWNLICDFRRLDEYGQSEVIKRINELIAMGYLFEKEAPLQTSTAI